MFLHAGVSWFPRRATRSLGVAAFALAYLVAARRTVAQVPGELRGRITDATTGRAIAGARIEIADRVEPARSDADGVFVVRGLEPKTYGVAIRAVGYAASRRVVSIENGRTALLDAALDPVPTPLAAVVSSARRPVSERETAAFDLAAIEASGKRDVGELLTTVPGVVVTRSGGPGQPTQVSIRGSSAAEVLVVVDGVVANSPLTGVADLSQLSLATIERVTVWEGAQSARYGGRALAGVVVVDTRRAEREGSLSLDAGSWGSRAVSGSIGDATESASRLSGMISAEHRTTRGDFSYDVPAVRGGGTALRANSDATSTSVLGVAGIDGSGGAYGCVATGAPRTEAWRAASCSRRSRGAMTNTMRRPRWSFRPGEAGSRSTGRRVSRATARTSPTRRRLSDPRTTTFSTPPRRGPRRRLRRPARSAP
jgi:outer membrane receptor protein involved in Fe transport